MKSVSKKHYFFRNTRFKIIAVIIILIVISGFLFRTTFWHQTHIQTNKSGSKLDGPTYRVKGQVTQKRTSCGLETLQADGTVKQGLGICDAGNSLKVDGLQIWTGGGALVAKPPKYITDIESISAGDRVEVRYVKEARGYASTNCESCYVKKM